MRDLWEWRCIELKKGDCLEFEADAFGFGSLKVNGVEIGRIVRHTIIDSRVAFPMVIYVNCFTREMSKDKSGSTVVNPALETRKELEKISEPVKANVYVKKLYDPEEG
jgi:hypothetical protein